MTNWEKLYRDTAAFCLSAASSVEAAAAAELFQEAVEGDERALVALRGLLCWGPRISAEITKLGGFGKAEGSAPVVERVY